MAIRTPAEAPKADGPPANAIEIGLNYGFGASREIGSDLIVIDTIGEKKVTLSFEDIERMLELAKMQWRRR